MALDDFDTHESTEPQVAKPTQAAAPARRPSTSEDEDLFDFPIVEMKLEGEAPKPAASPVKPPAPLAPAAKTPAPAPVAKPAASEPRKPSRAVAQAAQLVAEIQQVLRDEPQALPGRARPFGPAPLALAGVALLVLTNVFGLCFLWNTSRSFQDGVQAMNAQLAETLRRQAQSPSAPEHATESQAAGAHAAAEHAPAPLEAFELSSLQMAREEIQAGEYAAARRRLSRLLAVADRIEAGEREEIESQAAFLIASTYRKQAEAAREETP